MFQSYKTMISSVTIEVGTKIKIVVSSKVKVYINIHS